MNTRTWIEEVRWGRTLG